MSGRRLPTTTKKVIVGALKRHHGCLVDAAAELGLAPSTLWSRVDVLGLHDLAASLRPLRWWQKPDAREQLGTLIEKHRGRMEPLCRELRQSSGTVVGLIERFQLGAVLTEVRERAVGEKRSEIARLLEVHDGHMDAAARTLGMSTYGLRKLVDRLHIGRPIKKRRRPRTRRDKLKVSARVAQAISLPEERYVDPLDAQIQPATLRTLLQVHYGDLAAVAGSLGISRYRVGLLLDRHELRQEVTRLRVQQRTSKR